MNMLNALKSWEKFEIVLVTQNFFILANNFENILGHSVERTWKSSKLPETSQLQGQSTAPFVVVTTPKSNLFCSQLLLWLLWIARTFTASKQLLIVTATCFWWKLPHGEGILRFPIHLRIDHDCSENVINVTNEFWNLLHIMIFSGHNKLMFSSYSQLQSLLWYSIYLFIMWHFFFIIII